MIWLLAGIIPPLLWSTINHIDKFLLSKGSQHSSVNVLMVYSTGFSLIVIPLILIFKGGIVFVDWQQTLTQIIGGILLTFSIYFYLLALNKDEASRVVPLALLVPIFGYAFGYLLLNETLTITQLVACLIIILGAGVLSLEINEERKLRLKHEVLILMILCSSFQAAQETLFKFTTIDNAFWLSIFWLHIGIAIFGLGLILFSKHALSGFINSLWGHGKVMFSLNLTSELISTTAYVVRDYATLLAPIAIIMTLNGYQPAFVFILGIIFTLLYPKFVKEKISLNHLVHKGAAIGLMILGTVILSNTL